MGDYLFSLVLTVHVLVGLGVIGLVLMQHGKGADAGAAFGGGAGSASLFGASGGANFLSRSTAVLAAIFLACTLGLAYFGNLRPAAAPSGSVLGGAAPVVVPADQAKPADAQPASGAAQIPAK